MNLSLTLLWVLVVVAAVWDVWKRKIPNPLIFTGLMLGLAFSVQSGGLEGAGHALLGATLGLVILIGPFIMRVMGGGDVKLAMVCGAFTHWDGVLQIILIGTVIHGAIALTFVLARTAARNMGRDIPDKAQVPHAVGFAAATLLVTADVLTIDIAGLL